METEDPWEEDDGELEAEIMRADHPFGTDLRGTTPHEALAGLSIDDALAREQTEGRTLDEAVAIAADGDPDEEGQLVAEGFVVEDAFASPEEAAISVRDDAPGATDHEDHHPNEKD